MRPVSKHPKCAEMAGIFLSLRFVDKIALARGLHSNSGRTLLVRTSLRAVGNGSPAARVIARVRYSTVGRNDVVAHILSCPDVANFGPAVCMLTLTVTVAVRHRIAFCELALQHKWLLLGGWLLGV